jgi:hypothetical protein
MGLLGVVAKALGEQVKAAVSIILTDADCSLESGA